MAKSYVIGVRSGYGVSPEVTTDAIRFCANVLGLAYFGGTLNPNRPRRLACTGGSGKR